MYTSSSERRSWYVQHMLELDEILLAIRRLHDRIRQRVFEATSQQSADELSRVVAEEGGDLVFAIDRVSEAELLEFVTDELASASRSCSWLRACRGVRVVLPAGADQADCRWRIIVDPIDGTRCLDVPKAERLGANGRRAESWLSDQLCKTSVWRCRRSCRS